MMPMDSDSDSLNPDVAAALDTTTTPPPIPSNTERQLGDNNEGVKLDTIIPGSDMSTGSDSYNMQDSADSRMTAAPLNDMSGMSPDNSSEMGIDQNQIPNPLSSPASQYQPQTAVSSGGAKKSRRKNKNKKQSQSRHKKLKSRKHKK